jgi:eukaryotic-like serine/threonine-protein kinase
VSFSESTPLPEAASRPRDQTIARLGAGGMAEVFLIRRTGPGGFEKFLALKRIRAGLDEGTFAPMLLDEARLVAALQHPNIVQVHDAGADDDGLWFLMEYVHGKSLGALIGRAIDRGVPVPIECAAYIIACVGRALHYAHHAQSATQGHLGVIHRDVSPGNILVGYDGVVKLADFGIARANQRRAETQDGTFKGKYGYAAPEQCRGESLDGKSDLFSLGIVMHELLSARHLFSSDSPLATVEAVMHGPIPDLSSLRGDVPAEIDALVRRMLARDRTARIGSGAEAANELDAIAHRMQLPATRERMAELMAQLFSATEMKLQVPPLPTGEQNAMLTPLRAPVAGTPIHSSSHHSAVTAAITSPSTGSGRRLAHSSQPGSQGGARGSESGVVVRTPMHGVQGRYEGGSLSPEISITTGAQGSVDSGPTKRSSTMQRLAAAAVVGALSAVGVTMLLGRGGNNPPPAPAAPAVTAPAVTAPAVTAPAVTAPAVTAPAPATTPAPSAGAANDAKRGGASGQPGGKSPDEPIDEPPGETAATATPPARTQPAAGNPRPTPGKRTPAKATRQGPGKAANKNPAPAKKKPASDESLLERDW